MDRDDLAFAGLVRQAELVAAGEVSSRELTELALARIDEAQPRLNAFKVVLHEAALAAAEEADRRRGAGESAPLLGVPVAVKDDTDLAGVPTSYGTDAHGPPPAADAPTPARLRAAGAVIVGKTNVSEMTIWPFTETRANGTTRNPWAPGRTSGGSSGGSATAVAAGLVAAAQGTDGGGSIRIPAACCHLVGLKPTVGVVPHPQGWHGLSVTGPIARSVRDAALWMDVVADRPADAPSYVDAVRPPERRLRIAVSTRLPPGTRARLGPEQRAAFEDTVGLLRRLGHEVVERDPENDLAIFNYFARWLRGIHDDVREKVLHPERLERRTRGMVRLGALYPPPVLARYRAREEADRARVDALWRDADLLLTPGLATLPLPVGHLQGLGAVRTIDGSARFTPYTAAWNATGHPGIALPAGRTRDDVPLAVQVVGPWHSERLLLSLAAELEAERRWQDDRPAPP